MLKDTELDELARAVATLGDKDAGRLDDDDACLTCGGDGFSTWHEHPELWGEDACSDEDSVITCPDCQGRG